MRILLVDDDSSVLQALMATLRTIPGNDIRVAANAPKAHEHAAAMGGVDLLISDVVMEPTDGFTLRAELEASNPRMRTIFISGYDLSDYTEQTSNAHVLAKPVDANVLRAVVTGNVQQMAAAAVNRAPVAVAATPVAQPQAVARAVAQPTAGIPSAAPRAVAQPQAVAQPVAAVQPQAVARPAAAAPTAVAAAVAPVAVAANPVAAPRAAVASPVAVASGVHAAGATDPLIGVQLGDYRVQQLIGKGTWGAVYVAIQMSVNRAVGLKVLDPGAAQDERNRNQFLADARAKAAVQHPFIVSVFEADDRNGLVFYTHEFIEGATLEDMIEDGRQVDEKTALHIMKVAGEGLNYLWSHNLAHAPFQAESIRIGKDNIPRLANLATASTDPSTSVQAEIQFLASVISQLMPHESMSPGLRALLARMGGSGANAATSWPVVLQAVRALEPKVIPVEAAKIKAADAAAMRAMEANRKAQKRSLIYSIATLTFLAFAVVFVIWRYLISNRRDLSAQIEIPGGQYMIGDPNLDPTRVDLGAFEIDKYEVTIGAFEDFVKYVKAHPEEEHKWDHPSSTQKHVAHLNQDVLTLISNARKRGGTVFHNKDIKEPGVEVDLNCPMVGISWWTAYAYANWKGRELPTEEQWEAAARGNRGFKYPWDDELKLGRMNSNEGYEPMKPGAHKPNDGYNYWAPVDIFTDDESPFKVIGMAGNVAEWVYRKNKQRQEAVIKGGSFATPPIPMYARMDKIVAEDCWFIYPEKSKPAKGTPPRAGEQERQFVGDPVTANTRSLYIGFRTVKPK